MNRVSSLIEGESDDEWALFVIVKSGVSFPSPWTLLIKTSLTKTKTKKSNNKNRRWQEEEVFVYVCLTADTFNLHAYAKRLPHGAPSGYEQQQWTEWTRFNWKSFEAVLVIFRWNFRAIFLAVGSSMMEMRFNFAMVSFQFLPLGFGSVIYI